MACPRTWRGVRPGVYRAGQVKDASGAVLPGVTVEAASPALIEKVRSVTTDGAGQYRIVDLRPGVYSVTFALPGFNTVKREGVELTGSFTAPIDAEMRVGAIEETITVTGETPIVDVQSATRQRVLDHQIIDAIPSARNPFALGVLIPGVVSGSQDVGGVAINAASGLYGERLNQVDLRMAKVLRFGRVRSTLGVDVYNALNVATVLAENNNFATWRRPTSILTARFAKISAQFDF